jgi:hypothetical protein
LVFASCQKRRIPTRAPATQPVRIAFKSIRVTTKARKTRDNKSKENA